MFRHHPDEALAFRIGKASAPRWCGGKGAKGANLILLRSGAWPSEENYIMAPHGAHLFGQAPPRSAAEIAGIGIPFAGRAISDLTNKVEVEE